MRSDKEHVDEGRQQDALKANQPPGPNAVRPAVGNHATDERCNQTRNGLRPAEATRHNLEARRK